MAIDIVSNGGGEVLTGIVAIHAALVPRPGGKAAVVYFGTEGPAYEHDADDLETPPVQLATSPGWWAFCAGHAIQGDGRWIVAGGVVRQNVTHHGHDDHDSGERRCSAFAPLAGEFTPIADLNFQPGAQHGGGRWYPTVVTLTNGQVFAVAGHPFSGREIGTDANGEPIIDTTGKDDYVYPGDGGPRHNNNTPERFVPHPAPAGRWELLTAESTSHGNQSLDEYPRLHLAPSGHVFFSTIAKGDLRFYDPMSGTYDGTTVLGGHEDYHHGSAYTSVLLPILPADEDVWVLACGATDPERVNISVDQPAWLPAGQRALAGKPLRENGLAVLLADGDVFVVGGELGGAPDFTSPTTELYRPAIDWDAPGGPRYTDGQGTWSVADEPLVGRGYHSVALLLPDGRVWIAGSTWSDWGRFEQRIEVYTPDYIVPGRIEIDEAPPSTGYDVPFEVTLGSATPVSRVALVRCGSVTHSFDSDQRYVVCSFTQDGETLTVQAPADPATAPPGYYLLFVLDEQHRPCVRAAMVRVADQRCVPVGNRSTYSSLEVEALTASDGEARFGDAVWLFLEEYLPHEAGFPAQPQITVRWDSPDGPEVDPALFRLEALNPWAEDDTLPPDSVQRFALRYDVVVAPAAYDELDLDERTVAVTWDFGHVRCGTQLRLTTQPNPFMVDVEGGNPHWLSSDLRVFLARPGGGPPAPGTPAMEAGEQPLAYLARVLDAYNAAGPGDGHPFRQLPAGQDASALELRPFVDNAPVFNFAVAKVRYLAVSEQAQDVRVLFRMFNTVGTALDFDSAVEYRRTTDGPGTSALLGRVGPVITSIPFFQDHARVTPGQSMTDQPPDGSRDLPATGAEAATYFGAWLDINQETPQIPSLPMDDGPYPASPVPIFGPQPIQTLVRAFHQCLVAEVHTVQDEIPDAAKGDAFPGTPANNDNLSQRNLAWVPVGNPGSVATRRAQTTFVARPSGRIESRDLLPVTVMPRGARFDQRWRRRGPDELVFDATGLPEGSRVSVYLPHVDPQELLMLAARRFSPVGIEVVDDRTVAFTPRPVAYLPLPGGTTTPIPGLLTVELPEGVRAGERYRLVVHQLSGSKRRVVGTFQLELPVEHEADLLADETVKLSLLRHIDLHIADQDRWKPVFDRYLGEIAERVRGFGGDPDKVRPSPHGDGGPARDPDDDDGDGGRRVVEGKVREVTYDCFGDFTGFVLETCEGRAARFRSCEPAIERLVREACAERLRIKVVSHRRGDVHGLSVVCC